MPKIVILTGAGISAESGLKTFRDNNGLWENHRVEEVATPEAFAANPDLVYRFYNLRRASLAETRPNSAHAALAELEQHLGSEDFLLVTQNVDNLHEQAGSQRLLHMHGELTKARCTACQSVHEWPNPLDATSRCPACHNTASLRPHIVWFGEMPLYMSEIYQALAECDVFVSVGTSGNVYPAAGFYQEAKAFGARTIELNLEPSANARDFDEGHYGPATKVVPEFVAKVKTGAYG
ncbi:NAD-dependent protein deacylase [Simiduia sp. 21SJ11W-1]|uniref:Sir2 family NAD+-dependent deacetylase n=1 Tax=Simiduia sp. 21SJ11W-1 TaxID=2909669 RepID=UPI00209F7D81|nr:Sir2 family NAD+-dependent deacetylase [Simiduia sp. 21SJ11W-1]UTA46604.1 NAD-dependent protein deacylase [Simiduia sp. 21SJ11W-1]